MKCTRTCAPAHTRLAYLRSSLLTESTCVQGLLGKDHIEVATMLNNMAGVRLKRGECDETVEMLCHDAYRIKSQTLGTDHVQVAEILNNLALLRQMQGDTTEALNLTQQALVMQEGKWGRSHVSTAHTLHCKALFHQAEGDTDEAVQLCKEAIKVSTYLGVTRCALTA